MQFWGAVPSLVSISKKVKGKYHLITGHEDPERKKRCGCALSSTSALDGGEW
jgi:hypothetical protein